jgi:hypothetical protein
VCPFSSLAVYSSLTLSLSLAGVGIALVATDIDTDTDTDTDADTDADANAGAALDGMGETDVSGGVSTTAYDCDYDSGHAVSGEAEMAFVSLEGVCARVICAESQLSVEVCVSHAQIDNQVGVITLARLCQSILALLCICYQTRIHSCNLPGRFHHVCFN